MIDTSTYPRPRTQRTVAATTQTYTASGAPAPSVAPPRVRLWPFLLREQTNNERGTLVSPTLVGPAILDVMVVHTNYGGGSPHPNVQLYYATAPGQQASNQASTLVISGNPIFQGFTIQDDQGVAAGTGGGPVLLLAGTSQMAHAQWPLRFPITDASFVLKLSISSQAVGSGFFSGYIRILEGLTQEQLANFL